jgi:hypothetical protein
MTAGAIDNEFADAEQQPEAILQAAVADLPTEPQPGGVAFDIVTRQPLYVLAIAADSLTAYYEREEFDLLSYKTHPYLPVRSDDTVYECVYIPTTAEQAHRPGKTYDMPRGRLMTVPVELAGDEDA